LEVNLPRGLDIALELPRQLIGDDTTLAKSFIISLENVAAKIHCIMGVVERKVPNQFPRFPSRA
jgi:hypothetical protein